PAITARRRAADASRSIGTEVYVGGEQGRPLSETGAGHTNNRTAPGRIGIADEEIESESSKSVGQDHPILNGALVDHVIRRIGDRERDEMVFEHEPGQFRSGGRSGSAQERDTT